MLYLKETFGINTFNFYDANIVGNGASFMKLAKEMIKRIPGINWMSIEGMQVSTLTNPEIIDAIYESGCKWFVLPFESGSQVSLKKVGKIHNVEDVSRVTQYIRKWDDSWVSGNVITGFPWDKKEDIEYSLSYAQNLDFDWIYV